MMRAYRSGKQKQKTRGQSGSTRSHCAISHHATLYLLSIHTIAVTMDTHNTRK